MQPIEIACPVQGVWSFMNPPGHHPHAKDFVAVDEHGRPYPGWRLIMHLLYRLNVTDTYAWSKPVFSPVDGRIIALENHRADRIKLNLLRDLLSGMFIAPRRHADDPQFFPGNYVIIQADNGIYAMLAHLKQGSIRLRKDMRVRAGDPVAEVGNSGNSIQPHLHFQLMHNSDFIQAVPEAFVMRNIALKKNALWDPPVTRLPANREIFRAG